MIVAIVGAGNMGRAIATRALAGGHEVRLVDADRPKAEALAKELASPGREGAQVNRADDAAGADVVILALPYPAGQAVVRQLAPGTIAVDISNPVEFTTFDSLATPPGTSAAEEIAKANPDVRVVKAFNMTFAATLVAGEVGGQPLDVFIAGDDEQAKAQVDELVRSGGMRPLDAGPLRRARELEAFQFLHMTLQDRLGLHWSSAIKLLP